MRNPSDEFGFTEEAEGTWKGTTISTNFE
jgi:hypothetical protein